MIDDVVRVFHGWHLVLGAAFSKPPSTSSRARPRRISDPRSAACSTRRWHGRGRGRCMHARNHSSSRACDEARALSRAWSPPTPHTRRRCAPATSPASLAAARLHRTLQNHRRRRQPSRRPWSDRMSCRRSHLPNRKSSHDQERLDPQTGRLGCVLSCPPRWRTRSRSRCTSAAPSRGRDSCAAGKGVASAAPWPYRSTKYSP